MSFRHSNSIKRSRSTEKHIPTPPPLPQMRSKVEKTTTKTKKVYNGATIGYDGFGRPNWLIDLSTDKIYSKSNNGPLDFTKAEIKAIESKNDTIRKMRKGGSKRQKMTKKKYRRHKY